MAAVNNGTSSGGLPRWCPQREVWVGGWALNPCLLETTGPAAAGFVLMVWALVGLLKPLKMAVKLRHEGRSLKGPIGMSGGEAGMVLATSFIAALHVVHGMVTSALDLPCYHLAFHCALATMWALAAGFTLFAAKVHVPLDLRPLAFTAGLLYAVDLETQWSLYGQPIGYPKPYVRATIWTLLLQGVVCGLMAWGDFKRHPRGQPAAGPEGYQALAPGDVEAPAGSSSAQAKPGGQGGEGAEEEQHSWVALFADTFVYVWPEDRWLQLRAVASFLLLMSMRVLNLAVPLLYKKMVDALAAVTSGGSPPAIWGWLSPWVLGYLAAIALQGGAGGGMVGFINNLRQFLWIPVAQDAYRRISLRVFDHVMGLDLSFHLGRKTGEITKQIERGTNAMQNLLSTIMFSILPTCVDVLAASTYLAQALEPSIAVTVFVTVGSYIPITVIITEWRGALRREMNQTDQVKSARVTDALLNYETIKYFTAEDHERKQYENAINDYQTAEFKSMASINLLNSVQSVIMWVGISIGLLVCSKGVHTGELTVGDLVLFLSLMAQLYGPLNYFGMYYRTIQQYMIDMENLFGLLGKKSEVVDKEGCKELVVSSGSVEYDGVSFSYDRTAPSPTVLKSVSFIVPGGKTAAFVGATGSGKSTLTRLMFRFFDPLSGSLRVDGQDLRDVSQASLRRAVGMVPQDIVLFNDTILANIRYGNLSATDEEVYAAARAAAIHDAITSRFPKGYDTLVGERGLKLSGGEKQRVAFARALLKNPQILVLDEATSALDTLTERSIQAALAASRTSRTTLIVAHRLSTIIDADLIVCMHLGEVVEVGSHAELLSKQGLYAQLWAKQSTSALAVEEGEAGSSTGSTAKAVTGGVLHPSSSTSLSEAAGVPGGAGSDVTDGEGQGGVAGGSGMRGRGRGRGDGGGRGGRGRSSSVASRGDDYGGYHHHH